MDKELLKEYLENESTKIVIDANILLDMIRLSPSTSMNLIRIFGECFDKIWLPSQVLLEYERNKHKEIGSIGKRYKNFEKSLLDVVKGAEREFDKAVAIGRRHEYKGLETLIQNIKIEVTGINAKIEEYKNSQGVVNDIEIKGDQVLKTEAFVQELKDDSKIGEELSIGEKVRIIAEGEIRYKYLIPPGYKDAETKTGIDKFGDLFIWNEILKYSNQTGGKVLFLTNDGKEDWYEVKGEEKTPIKIRTELKKEFIQHNPTCDIEFCTLDEFHTVAAETFGLKVSTALIELQRDRFVKREFLVSKRDELQEIIDDFVSDVDIIEFGDEYYECNDIEVLSEAFEIGDVYYNSYEDGTNIYYVDISAPCKTYARLVDEDGDTFNFGEISYNVCGVLYIEVEYDTEAEKIQYVYYHIEDLSMTDVVITGGVYDDDPYDSYEEYKIREHFEG